MPFNKNRMPTGCCDFLLTMLSRLWATATNRVHYLRCIANTIPNERYFQETPTDKARIFATCFCAAANPDFSCNDDLKRYWTAKLRDHIVLLLNHSVTDQAQDEQKAQIFTCLCILAGVNPDNEKLFSPDNPLPRKYFPSEQRPQQHDYLGASFFPAPCESGQETHAPGPEHIRDLLQRLKEALNLVGQGLTAAERSEFKAELEIINQASSLGSTPCNTVD